MVIFDAKFDNFEILLNLLQFKAVDCIYKSRYWCRFSISNPRVFLSRLVSSKNKIAQWEAR